MLKKIVKEVIISLVIGIVSLIAINLVGQLIGFHIPINVLSVILIGFFRVPGLIVVLVLLLL